MSLLSQKFKFLRKKDVSPSGHQITEEGGREWENFYRDRWSYDKVVRTTHGVNCTGSCSWNIYVKNGVVAWENQATDYPETPDDMPDIDYLVISHDHWDHLDYNTVKKLKDRIGAVICPLGVGEHFEYWGFDKERLIELDWNEDANLAPGFMIHCLPARHFSGRGLTANQSLWASFLLETPSQKIYIGGDGGYDTHYAEIGNRFPDIDLVILENGQYNEEWSLIHLMPQYMAQTARDLKAKRVLTVHHSKYALAKHRWDEPLKNAEEMKNKDSLNVLIPEIGEVVALEK